MRQKRSPAAAPAAKTSGDTPPTEGHVSETEEGALTCAVELVFSKDVPPAAASVGENSPPMEVPSAAMHAPVRVATSMTRVAPASRCKKEVHN